jgi:hypothetical protein
MAYRRRTTGSRTGGVAAAALVLSLLLTSCGLQPRASVSPSPSSADAGPTTSIVTYCDDVDLDRVAAVVGQLEVLADASTASICAVRLNDGGATYGMNLRIEDAFSDLDAVIASAPSGRSLEVSGYPAFWGETLPVLWVEADRLYAVQVLETPMNEEDVLYVATEVAKVLVDSR